MNDDVIRDLSRSAAAMQELVWPAVQHWFGGGKLYPVEVMPQSHLAHVLDTEAGVDSWLFREGKGVTAIASRVQWLAPGCRPYNSITIRAWRASGVDTELQKRLRALQAEGSLLAPAVTIQAYVGRDTGRLLSVGCVSTKDLIANWEHYPERVNGDGRSRFRVAFWTHLEQLGCRIRTWQEEAA